MNDTSLIDRCRQIEWILSDVDGVMTDGGVIINDRGEHTIRFHIHDGLGVRLWRGTGRRFGILTGRDVQAVRIRGQKLHVDAFYDGVDDKLRVFEGFLADHNIGADHVCYIGDDLLDLGVLRRAGLAIAVPGAPVEVRDAAHYVTGKGGGDGAVRDAIEFLLKTMGEWDNVLAPFNK
jgi:3-deoxy-D-manno-octulosonate 8-phosphate phosphatase (KDO 8-P phosphatase)